MRKMKLNDSRRLKLIRKAEFLAAVNEACNAIIYISTDSRVERENL